MSNFAVSNRRNKYPPALPGDIIWALYILILLQLLLNGSRHIGIFFTQLLVAKL